jgi:uncharacterized protein (DUF1330 family)
VKANYKMAFAVLAGIVIGGAGTSGIYAQSAKTPPGFVVAEIEVMDPAAYKKYLEQIPATQVPFNNHYLVRGGRTKAIEGEPPKGRIIINAFPSYEQALAWEYSPAYEAIKPIRHGAAKSRVYIVEGIVPE